MSPVSLKRHGAVSVITIDNPPVNALSQAVREGLVTCVDAAEADDECKAIVIRCDGRTFIAGADIKEFGKPPLEPYLPAVVNRIEACVKPVIAAIHGTALGGGFETAMGCHYRIADPKGAVGLPEVNLGLLPGAGGTQRLPRLTGAAKALDIMLSGKPVKAPAALEAGAIDAVTDGGDLEAAAIAFVRYQKELNSSQLVDRLIREQSTYVVPGDHFGLDHHLRISYGLTDEYVNEGLRRLLQVLRSVD